MNNLFRLRNSDASYREWLGNTNVHGFDVYDDHGEKFGKAVDVLTDETQRSYYLGVEVGSWLNRKQVLLPLERVRVNPTEQRIYTTGLDRAQVGNLPAYNSADLADHSHRTVERFKTESTDGVVHEAVPGIVERTEQVETPIPLEMSAPLDAPALRQTTVPVSTEQQSYRSVQSPPDRLIPVDRNHSTELPLAAFPLERSTSVSRDSAAPLVDRTSPLHRGSDVIQSETVPLLEERLLVDYRRRKVGEVIVRKEVETRMIQVPVRREKLFVEQVTPVYKQIAVVELEPEDAVTDPMLASQAVSSSRVEETFISIDAASQILKDVANHPDYQAARVKILFEDRDLQSSYQNWLEHQRFDR